MPINVHLFAVTVFTVLTSFMGTQFFVLSFLPFPLPFDGLYSK